jgi:hypothetical protein
MKNTMRCLGFIALVVVIGFAFVACDNGTGGGGGNPQTVTYTGGTGSNAYRLEITENTSRATYTPQSGDNFKLIEVFSTKNMWGTIEYVGNTETITLYPNNGSGPITVTTSGNGIINISGMGIWGDGTYFTGPGTLTTGGDGGLDWPPDAKLSQVGLGGLSNPGVTDLNWTFYPDEGDGASMVIYFSGNINTKNNILSYFASKGWEYDADDLAWSISEGVKEEYHYWAYGPNISFYWNMDNAGGEITAVN